MMPAPLSRSDATSTARVVPGPHAPPPLPFPARPGVAPPVSDPVTAPKPGIAVVPPVPGRLRWHPRHWLVVISFALAVVLPIAMTAWYLFARAQDQFHAHLGFAIRGEAGASALVDGMAGLAALAGASSSSDSAILEEFLHATDLVARVDARLDLATRWRRTADPVFAFTGDTTADLVRYWPRMVRFSTRPGSGLIGVSVAAFAPDDAAAIADTIRIESERLINDLSRAARDDALQQGEEELARTVQRLTLARQALATFRAESRIVDPEADLSGEMTVLTDLQRRLSNEMMTLELLRNDAAGLHSARNAEVSGVRIAQTERRIAAIRERLDSEREKFGGRADRDYTALLARFETLSVELEFAQQTYLAALGALDMARIEARQQSRYLAVYEAPRVPDAATGPRRVMMLAGVAAILLLIWSVVVLAVYGLRDRM